MPEDEKEETTVEEKPVEKPDPAREALDLARKAVETSQAQAHRANELARQVLERAASAPRPAPTPIADEEEELDTSDAVKVKTFVEKKVKKERDALLQQIDEVYTRDRKDDIEYRVGLEWDRASSLLPGFKEIESDVREYVRNVDPQILARRGTLEEAYYAVKGKKAAEVERQTAMRAQSSVSTTTRGGTNPEPAQYKATDDDRTFFQDMFRREIPPEKVMTVLMSEGTNIEDYRRAKKEAQGKTR